MFVQLICCVQLPGTLSEAQQKSFKARSQFWARQIIECLTQIQRIEEQACYILAKVSEKHVIWLGH